MLAATNVIVKRVLLLNCAVITFRLSPRVLRILDENEVKSKKFKSPDRKYAYEITFFIRRKVINLEVSKL